VLTSWKASKATSKSICTHMHVAMWHRNWRIVMSIDHGPVQPPSLQSCCGFVYTVHAYTPPRTLRRRSTSMITGVVTVRRGWRCKND
jgi:hypothetical protein